MPEFKDFKEMVEKPGWMGFDEPEEGDDEGMDYREIPFSTCVVSNL